MKYLIFVVVAFCLLGCGKDNDCKEPLFTCMDSNGQSLGTGSCCDWKELCETGQNQDVCACYESMCD